MNKGWKYTTPGIPDSLFIRDRVPMTREEIRVITLAKARLGPGMVIWDVGSGTGSISVEAARMSPGGKVYAIEKYAPGQALTCQNAARFGVENIISVPGEAPGVLEGLPSPHRVIIGGSGGNLAEILSISEKKLLSGGRVVINAVTLETLGAAIKALGESWLFEIVQVTVARAEKAGKSHLMRGQNPVFIISAWKEEDEIGG